MRQGERQHLSMRPRTSARLKADLTSPPPRTGHKAANPEPVTATASSINSSQPGKDDGRNQTADDAAGRTAARAERFSGVAIPGSSVAQGLEAVTAADKLFNVRRFIDGAKSAYEMVVLHVMGAPARSASTAASMRLIKIVRYVIPPTDELGVAFERDVEPRELIPIVEPCRKPGT